MQRVSDDAFVWETPDPVNSPDYIGYRFHDSLGVSGSNTAGKESALLGWSKVPLQIRGVNALPSEKAGINGPGAGSNHCQGCTEGSQQYANPRIIGVREDVSQLNERREASDKRSP